VASTGISDIVPAALYREERERVEALHQQLNDTAALVGMLRGRLEAVEADRDRLLAITAGISDREDAPLEARTSPLRDDSIARAPEPLKPVSDTLALGWRWWWRRIVGDGSHGG